MKKLFAKTSGRITVAAIAILLIVLVVFLALRGRETSVENSQVVADAGLTTIESPEAPETEVPETETLEVAEQEENTTEMAEENDVVGNMDVEASPGDKVQDQTVVPESTDATSDSGNTNDGDTTESTPTESTPTESTPSGNTPTGSTPTPVEPEIPEADKYYQENGTIISVVDANESESVHTEEEVISLLSERGFTDFPITYEFVMGGEYKGATQISGDADVKRPMYQTYFKSENDEIWAIFVINGVVIANPASYNLESTLPAQLLISESEELTSYNNTTNKFYVTIPKESAVIVKVVDKIDADTLNQLTSEEIDRL